MWKNIISLLHKKVGSSHTNDSKTVPPETRSDSIKIRFYQKKNGSCSICENHSLLGNISKRCQHPADCCAECHKQSIRHPIMTKGASKFTCSTQGCSVEYTPDEYLHLLDQGCVAIVDKLLLNKALEKCEEFRWCKSGKGCGAGQLVSNHKDLQGYYTCHACDQMMCFRHSIAWHQGYTCDEFNTEKEKNPDFATDAAVKEFCKQCPNEKCKTSIMKHEGCDVITCCRYGTHDCIAQKGKCDHGGPNYCGQKFCWKCLGKIDVVGKENAFQRHCKETCDYYSLN